MLHIFGVKIPDTKKVSIGLQSIYGIGQKAANDICNSLGFGKSLKVNQLSDSQISRIVKLIESNYIIEGNLRKSVKENIHRLVSLGCLKGVRHRTGLPVRGQRTHTNATTQKRLSRSRMFR